MRLAPPLSPAIAGAPRDVGTGRALTLAAALLLLLWIPVHVALPMGRDQAIIARVAAVLLEGGLPYVDAWDHKGPAAYLLYAPALLIFGSRENALLWIDVVLLAALVPVFQAMGRRLGLTASGPLGVLLLVLCVRDDYRSYAQPDTWIGYLALALAALLLSPRLGTRRTTMLAAGAAIGFAAMTKPVFAAFLALPAVALATLPRESRPRGGMLLVLAGFTATVAAIAAPYVLSGHGGDLWRSYITFNLAGHWDRGWEEGPHFLVRVLAVLVLPMRDIGMSLILAAALAGFLVVRSEDRRAAAILATGWLAAFVAVAAQRKAFPYHFLAIHGFTALFAAAFVSRAVESLMRGAGEAIDRRRHRQQAALAGLLIGGALAATQPHAGRAIDLALVAAGVKDQHARERSFCSIDYCPTELRALGAKVSAEIGPGESLFVWGFDSAIYLHARRPPVTRFGFSYPLVAGSAEWRERARAELIETLRASPPRIVVVQDNDFIPIMGSRSSRAHLAEFPALAALIAERYLPAGEIGPFELHRLRD